MRLVILILLLLANPGVMFAQATDTSAKSTKTAATATTATASEATFPVEPGVTTRDQLTALLSRNPRELSAVLAVDPNLIANDQFLAGHPELAHFVASHPEVKLQPSFYLGDLVSYANQRSNFNDWFQPLMAFSAFLVVAYALAWLVRMIVEQRRWNRLVQSQAEVHNKILDRFGSSAELLEYVKTPAGARFLESAPIQLYAEGAPQAPGLARITGSIQIGVIVAAGAVGALIVSSRYTGDTGQGLFALGVIALCLGGGFILSAIVSAFLARRLAAAADAAEVR